MEERPFRASLAIGPGVLLAGVASGIAFPILPIVGVRAGLSLPFIGAILAANRATRILSSPVVGALSDRVGGRRMLVIGLVLQVVVMALYIAGVVVGHPGAFFLVGRILHGPGSAGVFVAGQALALHGGGVTHGGRAAGTVRAAMALGVPLGLVAGGVVADRYGPASAFEMAFVGVTISLVLAWWLVPDLRVAVPKRAPIGEVLRGLADRRLVSLGALNFAVNFSASGMVLTTLSLVVAARKLSLFAYGDQGTAGILMGWMVVTEAIALPIFGRVGDRRKVHGAIAIVGLATLVPALVLVALAPSTGALLLGLALMGVGAGALGTSLLAIVGATIAPERRGTALGVLQVCGDVGGALGPLLGTALFAGSLRAPYLATAALLVGFFPFARYLSRRDQSPAT